MQNYTYSRSIEFIHLHRQISHVLCGLCNSSIVYGRTLCAQTYTPSVFLVYWSKKHSKNSFCRMFAHGWRARVSVCAIVVVVIVVVAIHLLQLYGSFLFFIPRAVVHTHYTHSCVRAQSSFVCSCVHTVRAREFHISLATTLDSSLLNFIKCWCHLGIMIIIIIMHICTDVFSLSRSLPVPARSIEQSRDDEHCRVHLCAVCVRVTEIWEYQLCASCLCSLCVSESIVRCIAWIKNVYASKETSNVIINLWHSTHTWREMNDWAKIAIIWNQ